MLTALLTAIAFIVGTFAERIVTAVIVLLLARWVAKKLRAIKVRLTNRISSWFTAVSHRLQVVRFILATVFGPTVWVHAAR